MKANNPPQAPKKSRQTEYVGRMKEAGMVALSSVYVPKVIAPECRELVRNYVANWESNQPKF